MSVLQFEMPAAAAVRPILTGKSRRRRALGPGMGACCSEPAMTFDYVLGGALALALTAYLVYALLRPERF